MKRHVFSTLLVGAGLLFGGVVAGCGTPEPEPTPTPVVIPTPTSSPSPTSRWSERGQLAVDGVQTYLDKWTEISQTLDTASTEKLAEIHDVAGNEVSNSDSRIWVEWIKRGVHLVGTPSFEVTNLRNLGRNEEGWNYYVTGCHSIENAYLADAQGTRSDEGRSIDRTIANYTVVISDDLQTKVTTNEDSGESC